MNMAAEYGGVQILERLQANRIEGCAEAAMDYVAKENHLEVVQWLHENRPEGRLPSLWVMLRPLEKAECNHSIRSEGCTTIVMDNAAERCDDADPTRASR